MLREFFLGFVKIHILHHAGEEPVYGLAVITELRRHGYEISPGRSTPSSTSSRRPATCAASTKWSAAR